MFPIMSGKPRFLNTNGNYIDLAYNYPADTEYPTRVLSFTETGKIQLQKRDANATFASRVVIWSND